MDSTLVRRGAGLLALLIAALVVAWLLLPSPDTTVEVAEGAPPAPSPQAPVPVPAGAAVAEPEPGEAALFIITPDGTKIPKTESCVMIAEWTERHVPHHTIADNIRDRALLFTEDDVACLTASDVPPFVLTYADMHMKRTREDKE